jgi:trehalose 6-phosphate synthase
LSRLVVVSNRVAIPRGASPGGLAVAVLAALETDGGVWFGWDGKVVDQARNKPHREKLANIEFVTMPLVRGDYENYYKGYANRVLWPLHHARVDSVEFERSYREAYERVNWQFATALLPHIDKGDRIWVHDYHLIPVGKNLRLADLANPVGFFLHIPFPPYDVFRSLPGYRSLLECFMAYDLVGFQTELDRDNFVDSMRRALGVKVARKRTLSRDDQRLTAQAFPISIDFKETARIADAARVGREVRRLRSSAGDRKLIVGVDRLDYSKGLPARFRAYEDLLVSYPSHRSKVVFLQVAQPSRGDVREYGVLRAELEAASGKINGRFAEYDWNPLRYLNKSYGRATIMGFLGAARVGFVTPLRDGMNLVAKEFIASQDSEDPGVLVLSELAGAACELEEALLVNPYDINDMTDKLASALAMPLEERRERWNALAGRIRRNDVHRWHKNFLRELERAAAKRA